MNFQQLLDGAEVLFQSGNPDVLGVEYDSRRIRPGFVFVATRGETTDGNLHIGSALAAGAVAVVSDDPTAVLPENFPCARVSHGRRALARLSANFYKHPAERIVITGITGTNGKSTTAMLLESMLSAARRKTALIGTIEYRIGDQVIPAPHTTPEALELNHFLAQAVAEGVKEAVMEVSSHALAQQRVFGIPYDVGVFTNLTQDHLDYHHTLDQYFEAKQTLFAGVGTEPPRAAVINMDDGYGSQLRAFASRHNSLILTYGLAVSDFHAEKIDVGRNGTRFDLVTPSGTLPLFSPLIGRVNIYNIMAAAAAAVARGVPLEAVALGVERLSRVPGRFEHVNCGQPFTVVVDYAHTPDALRNLTSLAREFVTGAGNHSRVITLFGCGGDRDRAKRPLMAEAAAIGSDFVVLTSDNPRSEDPQAIIADALPGLTKHTTPYAAEPDRLQGVALAIQEAHPGDIVLLAGKGHEKTQITREGALPFDDFEIAREVLRAAGYASAGPKKDVKNKGAKPSAAPSAGGRR